MSVLRGVKHALHSYSEVERDVRDATSNDEWTPPAALLAKISLATEDRCVIIIFCLGVTLRV